MFELTIKINGDDTSFTKKDIIYEPIILDENDATLKSLVESAKKEYNNDYDSIIISIKMVWE